MVVQCKTKIKSGDQVIVIAGKDKGARGVVQKILRSARHTKVLVEGVNRVKKHVRPNPQINESGGIKDVEAYMDISNVMIWNPVSQKAERIGYRMLEDGKKVRYFKSTDEVMTENVN